VHFKLLGFLMLAMTLALSSRATENADDTIVTGLPYLTGSTNVKQQLDLRVPAHGNNLPVLVMIHGGAWAIGDKANGNCEVNSLKARYFTSHGMIYVTVNYRLSPAVRHPEHVRDVAAAIRYVREHIAEYGGNPDRIYLMGHSAGAHLAALVSLDRRYLTANGTPPTWLRGVILLDGAGYQIPEEYAQLQQTKSALLLRWYRNAFTDQPDVQRDASPTLHVSPGYLPPFRIFYTARAGAPEQSRKLAAAIVKQHGHAEATLAVGKNHMTLNRDLGGSADPTTAAIDNFIRQHP